MYHNFLITFIWKESHKIGSIQTKLLVFSAIFLFQFKEYTKYEKPLREMDLN